MDYGAVISESIDYTREALVGKWATWLVFIICGLPFALIQFVFDPEKLRTAKTIDWTLMPWPQLIVLILAGFFLSFIISGYLVRVYRGTTPPPEFNSWGSLYMDGIKLVIVNILWLVPVTLVLAIMIALVVFTAVAAGSTGSIGLILIAMLIIFLIAFVLLVISILYSILGSVRFARTGSIREGIRFSAITSTIQAIGWGTYIIALLVLLVAAIIFSLVVSALSLIPFAGWIIQLVLGPLFTVFSARYTTRIYDHGAPQVPAPAESTTP